MNKDRNAAARKAFDPAKLQLLLEHIGRLLPDENERRAFYDCSQTPPPASLRINPLQAQSHRLLPHLHRLGRAVPDYEAQYLSHIHISAPPRLGLRADAVG
mgnify:CR=1 FL=1